MNSKPSNYKEQRQEPHAKGSLRNSMFGEALLGLSLLAAMPMQAATRTWTGAVNTNWNNAANWDGPVPGNGDAVVVPNIGAKPSMASSNYPALGAFVSFEVQAGAVVTCLGNTNAVNAPSGGTTLIPHGTGVAIFCQSALINGTLHADGNGFQSGGPAYAYGGSYGGRSGHSGALATYGSMPSPTALGSAGREGASGGGAIRLSAAGALTVNGSISANGISGGGSRGGAGGSVWLSCSTFLGSGTVRANGSDSTVDSGGGGGRVAIEYGSSAFSGAVSVAGGIPAFGPSYRCQPGTLWEPNRFPNAVSTIVITNSYQYFFPSTASNYVWGLTLTNGANVYLHNFTNGTLTFTNLLVAGGSILRFDVDSASTGGMSGINSLIFSNSVTVAGTSSLYVADCRGGGLTSLVVSGSSVCNFSLCTNNFPLLPGVTVTNASSYLNFGTWMSLPALSSISMSTNTTLYLPAQTYTLTGDLNIPAGGVLSVQGNTNVINESSGGTAGKPHGIGVTINCQTVLINGRLSADGNGFQGSGYGGPAYAYGGSYGGRSGHSGALATYGSVPSPTALGSAGQGAPGGGAIRLNVVGTLTVNGSISANGIGGGYGGAGGSVWLSCPTFQGTGTVQAIGANSANDAPGGGGRVALEYGSSTFSGVISVSGGTPGGGYPAALAKTGTVFRCQSPWLGTTTTNGVNGRQLDTRLSVSSNNVRIARSITRFDTSLQWSDYSTDTSGSLVVTNQAIYIISGLRRSRGYVICFDGLPQFGGKSFSGADGVLTFTNTLDMLHNFFVTPAEKGTIFKGR